MSPHKLVLMMPHGFADKQFLKNYFHSALPPSEITYLKMFETHLLICHLVYKLFKKFQLMRIMEKQLRAELMKAFKTTHEFFVCFSKQGVGWGGVLVLPTELYSVISYFCPDLGIQFQDLCLSVWIFVSILRTVIG